MSQPTAYKATRDAIDAKRRAILALRGEIRSLQEAVEPHAVADYALQTIDGARCLSDFFGGKSDLIVIHNMGASCRYCTLWADGFNGVFDHLADRAAFLVTSPDAPDAQRKFAESRGWRFPMASVGDSPFPADMGYRSDDGGYLPGISVFQKRDRALVRVSDTALGPGDDFCLIWPMFEMFPEGAAGWMPQYSYAR